MTQLSFSLRLIALFSLDVHCVNMNGLININLFICSHSLMWLLQQRESEVDNSPLGSFRPSWLGHLDPTNDPTALRMLNLFLFLFIVRRVKRDALLNTILMTLRDWIITPESEVWDWSGIGLTPPGAPIVPLQGHFWSAVFAKESCAQPAALVYYKRRDCSIQSLQQRTFKFQFHSFSLLSYRWLWGVRGGVRLVRRSVFVSERHQLVARMEAVCDR